MTEETDFQAYKDFLRERLAKYTRKAFKMIPKLDRPCILDIGCGSGVPTMELAGLSNGEIVGLDVNQPLLDRLTRKIEKAGLSDRVKTVKCSMSDIDLPDESFDIIWAEGSVQFIGFRRGLKEWRGFLKPNGYLVVHDEIGRITEKLEQISGCGYELLNHFTLSENTWWIEYYAPLEQRIKEIRAKHAGNPEALKELDNDQRFIDIFKKDPKSYGSVFLIMKKR